MKKILLITSIILTLSIIVISTSNNMDNKENNIISNVEKNKQVITNKLVLEGEKPRLIDEWQEATSLWDTFFKL